MTTESYDSLVEVCPGREREREARNEENGDFHIGKEKATEEHERFRDNRQDVRRVTIANHNGDRKTRMTG